MAVSPIWICGMLECLSSAAPCGHRRRAPSQWPEYSSWVGMRQRCGNPNATEWPRYGGRGIRVAEEWLTDFLAFVAHVGPRPGPGYTLDRIDNDGHYEPGNVRWATATEQNRNKSHPRRPTGQRRQVRRRPKRPLHRHSCPMCRSQREWCPNLSTECLERKPCGRCVGGNSMIPTGEEKIRLDA